MRISLLVNGGLLQILRNAISTVDEDKFLGKDEVVIRVIYFGPVLEN